MTSIEEQITVLAGDIWSSVLGLPLLPGAAVAEAPPDGLLTGSVGIDGAWRGAILVQCSPAFAKRAATVMFGIAAADVGPAEVQDALGELANMVSGNVKALLPGPSRLALPTVAAGRSYYLPPEVDLEGQVWLDCEDDAILVSVVPSSTFTGTA